MRSARRRQFLLGGSLLLAGCSGGRSNGGFLDLGGLGGGRDRGEVRYRCDDDRSFRVAFDGRDRATVDAGGETYRLRLAQRDGRRREYGEGDVRLIVDGDEARLRLSGARDYSGCQAA